MILAGMCVPMLVTVNFCLRLDVHEFSPVSHVLTCTYDHLKEYDLVSSWLIHVVLKLKGNWFVCVVGQNGGETGKEKHGALYSFRYSLASRCSLKT